MARSASEFERRLAIPTIWRHAGDVVSNGEADLGHHLHTARALSIVLPAPGNFLGGLVVAVLEEEGRLKNFATFGGEVRVLLATFVERLAFA
jgi:hypothetical protein